MSFRPCIDLHGGQVKQIVGSTLADGDNAELVTNFTAEQPPKYFAALYAEHQLAGGHVIALGPGNAAAAKEALQAYKGGMQIGGGINIDNAMEYLDAGASHVIVTSYVFKDGKVDMERLKALSDLVGKERLVLDLSCRKRELPTADEFAPEFEFVVVTDRWQKWTDFIVNASTLQELAQYCAEFLVHGVDVEGKQCGVEEALVALLGAHSPLPVTYAGGVRHMRDLELVRRLGKGRVHVTVGSALDIFGGQLPFADVVEWHRSSAGEHLAAAAAAAE